MAAEALERENEELPNPDLASVRVPVLVGVGEHDKPDFRAIAERLARELPDARLEVIAGAGHLPSMEGPEATAALVRGFLKGKDNL
jgi:3-oxoadipate enol-lactonase